GSAEVKKRGGITGVEVDTTWACSKTAASDRHLRTYHSACGRDAGDLRRWHREIQVGVADDGSNHHSHVSACRIGRHGSHNLVVGPARHRGCLRIVEGEDARILRGSKAAAADRHLVTSRAA